MKVFATAQRSAEQRRTSTSRHLTARQPSGHLQDRQATFRRKVLSLYRFRLHVHSPGQVGSARSVLRERAPSPRRATSSHLPIHHHGCSSFHPQGTPRLGGCNPSASRPTFGGTPMRSQGTPCEERTSFLSRAPQARRSLSRGDNTASSSTPRSPGGLCFPGAVPPVLVTVVAISAH